MNHLGYKLHLNYHHHLHQLHRLLSYFLMSKAQPHLAPHCHPSSKVSLLTSQLMPLHQAFPILQAFLGVHFGILHRIVDAQEVLP